MFKTIITSILIIAIGYNVNSQCLPNGIVFETQDQIDNFQMNYPGCSVILGDVTIKHDDITNLNGLSVITEIIGGLEIRNNSNLGSLSGLDNLTKVGGNVTIGSFMQATTPLSSLDGLNNLRVIGGQLLITDNDQLSNISALSNLDSVMGMINIQDNDILTSLNGLGNLKYFFSLLNIQENQNLTDLCSFNYLDTLISISINKNESLTNLNGCEYVDFYFGIRLLNNDNLTDISALNNLTEIGVLEINNNNELNNLQGLNNVYKIINLKIVNNESLTSFTGLNNLILIDGDLKIESNQSLNNLSGLESLTNIGDELIINDNSVLADISALSNLYHIGYEISIIGNNNLTNLSGLEGITQLDNSLSISSNESLVNLSGLENITKIGSALFITENPNIVTLNGLNSLTEVEAICIKNNGIINMQGLGNLQQIESYFSIEGNPNLENLSGLNNLYSIGTDFSISENSSLQDFSGIDSLSYIGWSLEVYDNSSLASFSGLGGLVSIEQGLYINNNDSLINLSGFDQLNEIGEWLFIRNNSNLVNLAGIENLSWVGGNVYINNNSRLESLIGMENTSFSQYTHLNIYENSTLSECEVLSICNFLADDGYETIEYNSEGCNSKAEIIEACNAQPVCIVDNDLVFTSQTQIDDFLLEFAECPDVTVNGSITINGDDIISLTGLSRISSFEGEMLIWDNPLLTSLAGLNNITSIASNLEIVNNTVLLDLNGLSNLKSVSGSLIIGNIDVTNGGGNPSLVNLTGLEYLDKVGENLNIVNNVNLTSLIGIENLNPDYIDEIYISYNSSLSNCAIESICDYLLDSDPNISIYNNNDGCNSNEEVKNECVSFGCFPNGVHFLSQKELDDFNIAYPNCIRINGDVIINGNDINNLSALESINLINGNLEIINTDILSDLHGLEELDSIIGSFILGSDDRGGNKALISIENLSDLVVITGDLSIENNSILPSLKGLDSINPEFINDVSIKNNSSLSFCSINSICNFLDLSLGSIIIENNNHGCDSNDEVIDECTISIKDILNNFSIVVYPNPADEELYISNKTLIREVNVYNLNGQKVLHETNLTGNINISLLYPGLYILELKAIDQTQRHKLIVN